ncbi:MAG: DUF4760 domain-containing protein [Candidatus Thorarchaeota archaeon]
MVDLQTLFSYLTPISLTIGVIYHIMTLRNTRKNQEQQLETRQTNILMGLHSEWGSDEYQQASWTVIGLDFEDFEDFERKYGSVSEKTPFNIEIFKVCWFYNGLGVLVNQELADFEVVSKLFGYAVVWIWEILEPMIIGEREKFNQPKSLEWFEYLYHRIKDDEGKTSLLSLFSFLYLISVSG